VTYGKRLLNCRIDLLSVVLLTVLNQLVDASQVSVQNVIDHESASYLNDARFSTPSSLIVDTIVMGRGAMPEFKSFLILLWIAVTIASNQQVKEYVRLIHFCCIIDFPACRFACKPVFSSRSGVDFLAICPGWIG
jgi:hypothetical protein